MSTKVSNWVWDDSGLTDRSELVVMLALADISDHDGYAGYAKKDQRTQKDLARRCRMGESTFSAKVVALRAKGFLATSRDGRLTPNQYQLLVPWSIPENEGSSGRTPENEGSDPSDSGIGPLDSGVRSSIDVSNVTTNVVGSEGSRFAEPLCRVLIGLMKANGAKTPDEIPKRWLDDARLMIDKDGRDPRQAKALMEWAAGDSFWRGNILSLPKFREKYDQLRMQADRKTGRGTVEAGRQADEVLRARAARDRRAIAS